MLDVKLATRAAIAQAIRYAAQIKYLEDSGNTQQARKIRQAWRQFYWRTLHQFGPCLLTVSMHEAYWMEYRK